ncbi:MAG: aromatic acid exporter family protein [Microcystaceae cyanobacterium]
MNINQYIIKLALGAALAFAIGNTIQTRNMNYVLYGSILCIHPIAGDTVSYVLDKLKSALLGASFGMIVNTAFQGNPIISLPLGIIALITAGSWFKLPKRLLSFAVVVLILALSASYSNEPFEYLGLRFWNIFIGASVGIIVNIAFWPNRDIDKLEPAMKKVLASMGQFYDQLINDYRQGNLIVNTQVRQQLIGDITKQLNGIESLLGNARTEIWSPFANEIPYQRWSEVNSHLNALFRLVLDLGIALKGGDSDQLHWPIQTEIENLVKATHLTFKDISNHSLQTLPDLNQAIRDRLMEIKEDDIRSSTLQASEIKRMSALIYGLNSIASELQALAHTF